MNLKKKDKIFVAGHNGLVGSSIVKKLTPVVKSLMFGEACSNVPVFKK